MQFVYLNFVTNSDTLIGEFALSAAQQNDPQMEFEFLKSTSADAIQACWATGSGNTLSSFAAHSNGCFPSTDSTTDVFTSAITGGDTVRAGFETFEPVSVPEPPSLLLLFSGLLGLAGLAGWRRRSALARPSERR